MAFGMNAIAQKLAPSATDMIRRDHSKVVAAFHRYDLGAKPHAKRALVNTVCLAIEVHARIEEEIFYPALQDIDAAMVEKSFPEHAHLHELIAELRSMDPASADFDLRFMELMRNVLHHVADEETTLLPEAERVLGSRVNELGRRMFKRRMQLMMPHAGEMARDSAVAMPKSTMLLGAGALLAGAFLFRRASR
jgi:hypothetical protein